MKKYIILTFPFILLIGYTNNTDKEKSIDQKNYIASVLNAHSMAYHSEESRVYVFGGANEKEVLSDMWVLDSSSWRKVVAKNEPNPRTFASLIYDKKNNRLVLFGGSKVLFGKVPDPQNLLNDTWQFKDNQWKKLITNDTPSPRAEVTMAYDESRETIVLFGGYYIQNGEYIKLGDTWEFHNNDWQLITSDGPSARHGVSMAYDAEDKFVVLFGGSTIDKQYGEHTGETWKWNRKEWIKLDIEQPNGIFNASMVYDNEHEELIRFGGWNGKSRINETWSFSNNKWNKLDTEDSPSPRNHCNMAYDERNKRIILFGGHDGENIFGDTWEYKAHKWKKISESISITRVKNGH
jgi:hypothetical protein